MSNVAQLWNPRGSQKLQRHWVSFADRIVIAGDDLDQSGVLSVSPTGQEGDRDGLRARLRVLGKEFEELVGLGQDIVVWIHGMELVMAVRAVEDERMLVEFGVPPGSRVGVTLDSGRAAGSLRLA